MKTLHSHIIARPFTKIKFPITDGIPCELQFHTPESLAIKEINHKLYEEYRLLPPESAKAQGLLEKVSQNSSTIPDPSGTDSIK